MAATQTQIDAFTAALPFPDFRQEARARAAIECTQRGGRLAEATAAMLDGHEPNHLPAVEVGAAGALYRAQRADPIMSRSGSSASVTEAEVDVFLRAVSFQIADDPKRVRELAREAIDAAAAAPDEDSARWATGVLLDGVEVSHPLGVESQVSAALRAVQDIGGSPEQAVAAVIDAIVDPGAAPALHTVELERLALTWPDLAGRLAALVESRERPVPSAWTLPLQALRSRA